MNKLKERKAIKLDFSKGKKNVGSSKKQKKLKVAFQKEQQITFLIFVNFLNLLIRY